MTQNKDIDLGKSFEKLKQGLLGAIGEANSDKPESYAYAFGRLETAVKIHLGECTGETFGDIQKQVDDVIETGLFHSPNLQS